MHKFFYPNNDRLRAMDIMLESGPAFNQYTFWFLELEWKRTFFCERDFVGLGKVMHLAFND